MKIGKWFYGMGVGLLLVVPVSAEEVYTLDPVVVTATRTEVQVSEVASSVTVITGDEIRAMNAQSLNEVLIDAVGVNVVDRGTAGSQSSLSIRGSEAAQVLVLLDGVRLNSAQNGQFNPANLPVSLGQIERIEILRGSASALYGSNAMAGVVQIITRRPKEAVGGSLGLYESRNQTRGGSGSISGTAGAVDFRLGGGRDFSHGYRDNSDMEANRLDGQLGIMLAEKHRLEFQAFVLDKENGAPGTRTSPQPEDRQQDDQLLLSARLLSTLGESLLNTRVGYNRRLSRFDDPNFWMGAKKSRHELKTGVLETQWEKNVGIHQLVFGGDYYYDDLDSSENGQRHQQRGAVFGLYRVEPMEGVQLLAGLRWDDHSDFDGEASPRVGASYTFKDGTRLRAGVGKAFRAPTLNDRFWPDDGFTVGNPNLTPETAWEYEVGAERSFDGKGRIGVALFRRDVKDLIEWAPGSGGKWSPSNVGQARILGVEVDSLWHLYSRVTLGGNYTYLHPQDRDDDSYLQDRAKHEASGYVDVEFLPDWFVRFNGRVYHFYREANRLQNIVHVYDLALRHRFRCSKMTEGELAVGVKNLFDAEYELKTGYPMPPASPFIRLSMTF